MALGVNASSVKNAAKGTGPNFGLLSSAIITLVAIASIGFDNDDDSRGEKIYGVLLCCITIVYLGAVLKMEQGDSAAPHPYKFYVMALFAVAWIALASVVTFRGPFLNTGNGYFASWAGAITAIFAASAAKEEENA